MYTYNPHWGLSLVASREATRGTLLLSSVSGSSFSSTIHLFIQSFIHQFSFFPFCLCHSVAPVIPKGSAGRETVFVKKKRFLYCFLSRFHFLPGIPVPSFYSLRSFVIFGRVSDTLVCLGNRVEGPSRIAVQGSGDTRRVHVWMKEVDEGEGDNVTRWHG